MTTSSRLYVSSQTVLWTSLLVCLTGLSVGQSKKEKDGRCSHNAVVLAMTTCQGERHKLSLASQSNDTAKLCGALQKYSECMTPRIEGCKGPAKMAFDVITGKYASQPYNCKIAPDNTNQLQGGPPVDGPYHEHGLPNPLDDSHVDDVANNEVHNTDGATDTKGTRENFLNHPMTETEQSQSPNKSSDDDDSNSGQSSQTTLPSTIQDETTNVTSTPRMRTLSEFDPSANGGNNSRNPPPLTTPILVSVLVQTLLCLSAPN